jgi:hypothetical protein
MVDLKRQGSEIIKPLLLTKSIDWSYENEYRVILPRAAKQIVHYHMASLVGVILGARASMETKLEVETWLKMHPHKPLLHFAELNHDRYGVRFDPQKSK